MLREGFSEPEKIGIALRISRGSILEIGWSDLIGGIPSLERLKPGIIIPDEPETEPDGSISQGDILLQRSGSISSHLT